MTPLDRSYAVLLAYAVAAKADWWLFIVVAVFWHTFAYVDGKKK